MFIFSFEHAKLHSMIIIGGKTNAVRHVRTIEWTLTLDALNKPIYAWISTWRVLSGPVILLKLTSEWSINLQTNCRGVVDQVLMNNSPSNISQSLSFFNREITIKQSGGFSCQRHEWMMTALYTEASLYLSDIVYVYGLIYDWKSYKVFFPSELSFLEGEEKENLSGVNFWSSDYRRYVSLSRRLREPFH